MSFVKTSLESLSLYLMYCICILTVAWLAKSNWIVLFMVDTVGYMFPQRKLQNWGCIRTSWYCFWMKLLTDYWASSAYHMSGWITMKTHKSVWRNTCLHRIRKLKRRCWKKWSRTKMILMKIGQHTRSKSEDKLVNFFSFFSNIQFQRLVSFMSERVFLIF